MSKSSNLFSNNGIGLLSEIECDKITLNSLEDATDFNTGGLNIKGGLSVQRQTRLLNDLTLGEDLSLNNNKEINFLDTEGSRPYFILQNDNNFVQYATTATGDYVPVWGIPMRNSNSAFFCAYPMIVLNNTPTTSFNTGSFSAFGGISSRTTQDATALGNGGGLTIRGGGSIAKKLFVGGGIEMSGTSSSLRVPRLTTTQRDSLIAATGMNIYNSTTNTMNYYNGSTWISY